MAHDETANNQSGANALMAGVLGAAIGAAGAALFMSKEENREKVTQAIEGMKEKGDELKTRAQDTMEEARSRATTALDAAKGKAVQVIDEAEENVSRAAEHTKKKLAQQRPTTKGA